MWKRGNVRICCCSSLQGNLLLFFSCSADCYEKKNAFQLSALILVYSTMYDDVTGGIEREVYPGTSRKICNCASS